MPAAVAHVHAIDDGIPYWSAALNDPSTHDHYVVIDAKGCQPGRREVATKPPDAFVTNTKSVISRKREFSSFAGVLRPKVRQRHADESDAFGRREDRADEVKSHFTQPVPGFDGCFHRSAAG